jgi:hypothetical protein
VGGRECRRWYLGALHLDITRVVILVVLVALVHRGVLAMERLVNVLRSRITILVAPCGLLSLQLGDAILQVADILYGRLYAVSPP